MRKTLYLKTLFSLSTCLILAACGSLTGQSIAPNDARPYGTLVSQAQFYGLNGNSVSGSALIFLVNAGSYILRLEGLSAPIASGLNIQLYSPTGLLVSFPLRSSSGNQNYSFLSSGGTFATTYIYSAPQNEAIAAAQF